MFSRVMKNTFVFVLAALMLLTVACSSKDVEPDQTDLSIREQALVGDISLPSVDQRIGWAMEDNEDQFLLSGTYKDTDFQQAVSLLNSLEEGGWYLTGNGAYMGDRSIDISFDMDTGVFSFTATLDKKAVTWPEGVLTPYLRYVTPPFPYGTFDHGEEAFEGKAEKLVYTGVSVEEMNDYLGTLENAGFEDLGECMWVGNRSYVSYQYDQGVCGLIVAMAEIVSPLPPWPETLPEGLVRILPPIAAVITITQTQDGYTAVAEQTTLSELYGFISSASEDYGWSELAGDDSMEHMASGSTFQITSYSTDTNVWELTIHSPLRNTATALATSTTSTTPTKTIIPKTPTTTDGTALTPITYGYTVTEGRYSEEDAMMGVLDEFGQYGEMAEWSEIVDLYGDDFAGFLDDAGVHDNEDVWVQRNGSRCYGSKRHYFLAFINGNTRSGFAIHDQVDNVAWLGSWYDIELRVLVKVPSDQLK